MTCGGGWGERKMSDEHPRYVLVDGGIDGSRVEFPRQKGFELLHAKKALAAIRDIEELFTLFSESFVDFEKMLLVSSVDYLFSSSAGIDLEYFFEHLHNRINLSILTILTTYQAYDDQVTQRVSDIEPLHDKIIEKERKIRSDAYDSSLEYRICSKLRNYAQHSKLPLHGIWYGNRNQFEDDSSLENSASRHRTTISPYFTAKIFSDSKKFQKVRHEISALAVKEIDAKQLIRGFVASMSTRHKKFQDFVQEALNVCSDRFAAAHEFMEKNNGKNPKILHLHIVKDLQTQDTIYIKESLPRRLIAMQNRPAALQVANRCFVSSEANLSKSSFQGSDQKIWLPK